MTKEERQKEKELLLNVLKDGLPYGLQLQITDVDGFTFSGELRVLSKNWCRLKITNPAKRARVKNETIPLNYIYIKPYLRPMSSMTEEEKELLKKEHVKDEKLYLDAINGDGSMRGKVILHYAADWCNKNHFDFMGLISKGLAIEVTESNNPYK